jgi:presenilin enhancer 2
MLYLPCRYVCNVSFVSVVVTDVIRSMIGTVLWVGVIVAWVTVFQLNRASWGATGDDISFIIPKGIP